jgi:hypothetical protein
MAESKLTHKLLASGQLKDDTVDGNAGWASPGWTGAPVYTSPASGGTDLKFFLLHNLEEIYGLDTRFHFYGTGLNNRVLYINLPPIETAEWDFGYIVHINSGESIYGNVESGYGSKVNYYLYGAETVPE